MARKITGKSKVVSTLGSFHGRSFNTLSVSGSSSDAAQYLPTLTENRFVSFGDYGAMASAIDANTAAVIIEPIQGEGGVRIPKASYLVEVAAVCAAQGALLIVDEIQTGFCRTGEFFAIQHGETLAMPDILTMGKGIAGGFPFAAFAVNARVDSQINKGDHGGTYCGNPLGCAVAAAVVSYLQNNKVATRVSRYGKLLYTELEKLRQKYPALILEIRGRGLLCALELPDDQDVEMLTQYCMEAGLLITPIRKRVVRLIPSLLVSQDEIADGLKLLDGYLALVVGNR